MFEYPCPACDATNEIHEFTCEWHDTPIQEIRKAYFDILSVLGAANAANRASDDPVGLSWDELTDRVSEQLKQQDHPEMWRSLHTACLHELKNRQRVAEDESDGGLYLLKPAESDQEVIPQYDPMKTVYEVGPIDGCKDNAVFAMVSWCEFIDFDWEQTCTFMHDWMDDTGRWESESWAESSIDQLLENKRHIHEKGMGWKNRAEAAKGVMDTRDAIHVLDAAANLADYEDD